MNGISAFIKETQGTSLVVQQLGLGTFTAMGRGSVTGWGTKISASRAVRPENKKKRETQESSLGPLQPCENTMRSLRSKRGPFPDHAATIIMDFQPPEL